MAVAVTVYVFKFLSLSCLCITPNTRAHKTEGLEARIGGCRNFLRIAIRHNLFAFLGIIKSPFAVMTFREHKAVCQHPAAAVGGGQHFGQGLAFRLAQGGIDGGNRLLLHRTADTQIQLAGEGGFGLAHQLTAALQSLTRTGTGNDAGCVDNGRFVQFRRFCFFIDVALSHHSGTVGKAAHHIRGTYQHQQGEGGDTGHNRRAGENGFLQLFENPVGKLRR